MYIYVMNILIPDIGLAVWVFANGPGDQGSIPGRVIPRTQKMVLDASLLNTQHYKVRINVIVEQSREVVAPSPIPWCSSYRKGSLRVTLDYGRQLYLLYFYLWTFYVRFPYPYLDVVHMYLHLSYVLMLKWIIRNGTVFDIDIEFTLNWLVWNRTVLIVPVSKQNLYLYITELAELEQIE